MVLAAIGRDSKYARPPRCLASLAGDGGCWHDAREIEGQTTLLDTAGILTGDAIASHTGGKADTVRVVGLTAQVVRHQEA